MKKSKKKSTAPSSENSSWMDLIRKAGDSAMKQTLDELKRQNKKKGTTKTKK